MKYIARRPFAAPGGGNSLVEPGDQIEINNKSVAEDMMSKNLIWPSYKTKEDKEAMRVSRSPKEEAYIEWDAGPMFYVKQGDKVIDRLKKAEAEKLRDKLNR